MPNKNDKKRDDKKKPAKKAAAKPVAKVLLKAAKSKVAAKSQAKVKKVEPKKVEAKKAASGKAEAAKKTLKKAATKKIEVKKPSVKLKAKAQDKAAAKATPVKATKKSPQPEGKSLGKKAKSEEAVAEAAVEETLSAGEEVSEEESDEVVLTDADGRRYCRVKDCDQLSVVDGYCRYHYLLYWKRIQVRKKILTEGRLERYIEELTARYPDKFLDMLRKDLRSEKEFLAAIQELEIDESANENELEDESQNYIEEVRGMEPSARDDDDF